MKRKDKKVNITLHNGETGENIGTKEYQNKAFNKTLKFLGIELELLEENKDRCFYCGSKDTKTYYYKKAKPNFFLIKCNTCNENSIF